MSDIHTPPSTESYRETWDRVFGESKNDISLRQKEVDAFTQKHNS